METPRVAVIQLCVDDRLDHARIRAQVARKMHGLHLAADRIFLVNEIGGNFGCNFRNTVDLFRGLGAEVVFCAVLHHDDCGAAAAGRRHPMEQTVAEVAGYLAEKHLGAPVYTGVIHTEDSEVKW